jgi:dienelactone hydrolase
MLRFLFARTCLPTICLAVFAVAARGSEVCDGAPRADTRGPAAWRELFAYDTAAPLDVQVAGTKTVAGATVQDVTFVPRPDRPAERVAAYIVSPANARAAMPAVLWVHWLGDPATTNRTEFLDEATALAARGVVSVLVDAMWSKPAWYRSRVLEQDYATSIGQVVSLRRSLDLLLAQRGVDRSRVALVGHDYGGMYGAIVAGVDGRARTHVLVAATASLLDWAFFQGKKPVSMEAYRRQHEPLSLCDHLASADKVSFFFQFAEKDEYVTLARAQALFGAPTGAKQMSVYGGAGHAMTSPAGIQADRTAWLLRELGIEPRADRQRPDAGADAGAER